MATGPQPAPPPPDGRGFWIFLATAVPKLIVVAPPLVVLGVFLYTVLGLHKIGLSVISSAALLIVLFVVVLVSAPLRTAFRGLIPVLAAPFKAIIRAYQELPSNSAKLVFGLVFVIIFL